VQKVQKYTIIALEDGDQMVTIPANVIAQWLLGRLPLETPLILRNKTMKAVVSVREVARATPH
jgi:hypothetical protein